MAQVEEGWPLGLHPLNNVRVAGHHREYFGSASFNTLLSGSTSSSTDFSSDLDTESTGSFFHDKSTTLGRLMGVPSTADLPRRSLTGTRRRRAHITGPTKAHKCRPKSWCFFSLCPIDNTDAAHTLKHNNTNDNSAPSLGQFLAVERRAVNRDGMGLSPLIYGPDEIVLAQHENSLFVNGFVAPPQRTSPFFAPLVERRVNGEIVSGDGYKVPLFFSCMCG